MTRNGRTISPRDLYKTDLDRHLFAPAARSRASRSRLFWSPAPAGTFLRVARRARPLWRTLARATYLL